MSKFYDFEKELEEFAKIHKLKAPNSWKTDVDWLANYVFHFFLDVKQVNNINNWSLYFEEFRTWLLAVKPLKGRDKLSYNSVNKAIKALNRFLAVMSQQSKCSESAKCAIFPKELCNKRSAKDCWSEDEILATNEALKSIRRDSADLFLLLVRTGLRENEALGLCLPFVKKGLLSGKHGSKVHEALTKVNLGEYYGFICLESQPAISAIRDQDGKVLRKPLKSRREIHPKWFRYIPIADKEAWNILVRRWQRTAHDLDAKKHGDDERDYLLFDGFTASKFYNDPRKAFETTKLRYRVPHSLRHTFLTTFYEATYGNPFLAEVVAGHRDKAIVENYSHAAEQRGLEMRGVKQQRDQMIEVS